MNQKNRVCLIHEEFNVYHVCTLLDCKLNTRWCCSECIQKGIHQHDKANISHIMNRKEMLTKLTNEYQKFKKDFSDKQNKSEFEILEKIQSEFQRLEQSLINYMKIVEQQIHILTTDENQARFEQHLNYLIDNNFEQLDDDKINQLLNFNNKQKSDQNIIQQFQLPINIIKQQLNRIESLIRDYQVNQNFCVDLKNRKFSVKVIDQADKDYYGSQISNNQQYLAYGTFNKLLKIYNLEQNKIIQQITLDNSLYVCQFTKDSSQLYVGLGEGFVNGYDVMDDFKQIFRQQIHQYHVYNIITIQNQHILSCSHDKTIIKTDIKSRQQIFKLIGHTYHIIAIDYDHNNDVLISGSGDQSIKLWNCKNQTLIIDKQQAHNQDIRQIQFINQNQSCMSLDLDGNIIKWKIDLKNKDLNKLLQFSDQNKIWNFYQVNWDQNLLLICSDYIKILNVSGQTLSTIQHDGGNDSSLLECKQLDNLKYIQIRALSKIILAIAQD